MQIKGNVVVEGIGIGNICFLDQDYEECLQSYIAKGAVREREKYESALSLAKQELEEFLADRETLSKSEVEIMEAHQMLLEDAAFVEAVARYIEQGSSAPESVLQAVDDLKAMFDGIDDPYLKERQKDIIDIGNRILRKLLGIREFTVEGDEVVLYAHDMEPSIMAGLPEQKVKAVLLGSGSKTSHAVILARAKGFVTMVGVELSPQIVEEGEKVIVDARKGEVLIKPSETQLADYTRQLKLQEEEQEELMERAGFPACTLDGREVITAANISRPEDMQKAEENGCQGVGLYRTEFLFMESKELPDEEMQFRFYRAVAEQAKGSLCIIRTLDIGGDKHCDSLKLPQEENPFLGFRAIRICLKEQAMFKTQLRAILRAGAYGKVGIMIPMVTGLSEITETKKLIEEAKEELRAEQLPFGEDVPVGIMVETPASVVMAPVFAGYVDFFSIGTNDLVQYTLAVDRGNQTVSYLYDYFHPAVLKSIYQVVAAAHEAGIWAGMCGEMASDRAALPFLLAIGMDELSMSSGAAPRVKETIRNLRTDSCDLTKLFAMTGAKEAREYLESLL